MFPARSRVPAVPFLVAALVIVLLGGTAYAAPLTSKKVKRIAAKVVQRQAPNLSVAQAQTAVKADTATRAATADTATKATTATNATNATNAANATQAQKLVGYQIVQRVDTLLGAATNFNGSLVLCPLGKRAVGGGAILSSFQAAMNQSGPSADGTGWDVDVIRLNGNADVTITTRVICLPV